MRSIVCWIGGALIGAATMAFLSGSRLFVASAAPGAPSVARAPDSPRGPTVALDERNLRIVYANAYRIHTGPEEVILDLGLNMPNPIKRDTGDPELLFSVTDRVVMTYVNAKKLSLSLSELVRRYEHDFGELPAEPGARKR